MSITLDFVIGLSRERAGALLNDAVGVGLVVTAGIVLYRAEARRRLRPAEAAKALTTIGGSLLLVVVAGLLIYLPPAEADRDNARSTTEQTITTRGDERDDVTDEDGSDEPSTTTGSDADVPDFAPSTTGAPSMTASSTTIGPVPPPTTDDTGAGDDTATTTTAVPPSTTTLAPHGDEALDDPPTSPADSRAPPATGDEVAVVTHDVVRGDSLWEIAEIVVDAWSEGTPTAADIVPYWASLVEANADRLVEPGNPDLILPGQQLAIPPLVLAP